jgi:glycerol-3-phosphate acyltransferase PlsY
VGTAAATALVAYLIGSIPAAYLVGRMAGGLDVRVAGEGNAGARNVFHEVGPVWGVVVFGADFGKGLLVALLFRGDPLWQLGIAGVFVILGHGYPIWLRFVGGKGLASAIGFMVGLLPLAALVGTTAAAVTWLVSWRFLPTTVAAIVVTIVSAPLTGAPWAWIGISLGVFLTVALKRLADEARMREIESRTGWDRARGGSRR